MTKLINEGSRMYKTLKRDEDFFSRLVFIYKSFLEQTCVVHLMLSTGTDVMIFNLWKKWQSSKWVGGGGGTKSNGSSIKVVQNISVIYKRKYDFWLRGMRSPCGGGVFDISFKKWVHEK